MKKASVRPIAGGSSPALIPEDAGTGKRVPGFQARLRTIYGEKVLEVSGAELVSSDRGEVFPTNDSSSST